MIGRLPSIRLIVADVDGTLLGASREISPRVRDAIRAARSRGVQVALCTGRPMFATRRYIEELQLSGFHIVDGGATILDPFTGAVLYRHGFTPALARDLLGYAQREGICLELYSGDAYYVEAENEHSRLHTEVMRHPPVVRPLADVVEHLPVTKMETLATNDEERARLRAMAVHFAGSVDWGWSYAPGMTADFVNIIPKGVSKGQAVVRLIDHAGIPVSQVMGVGDALNDEPLLRAVGLPVAMGHAPDALKRIARWITSSVEEDGLALAVERYVLSNGREASAL
jgi:Cof subfamily protein (haloacid dehalogenase superfamily)